MPLQPGLVAFIAVVLLALGVVLWLFVAAVRSRRRWFIFLLLAMPALCLLCAIATLAPAILGIGAPQSFFDRAAPVPDSAIVYYLATPSMGDTHPVTTLHAYHGRTGKQAWQRVMPGSQTSLASDSDTVYVVSSALVSTGSQLLALNLATGAVRWQETLQHETGSSLLLTHGVLFMAAASPDVPGGSQLLALRPSDGARLWAVSLPGSYGRLPTVFATDDTLVFQSDAYAYESLSLTDGHVLWSGRPEGSIVVGPHTVYELGGYGALIARDALTGATLWQYGDHDLFHAGVASGEMIYVTAQHSGTVTDANGKFSNPETVYALDAATGHLRWQFATQSGNYGTLLASASTIYVHADDGIHALRASDGTVRWHSAPQNNWTFFTPPSDAGPVVYVSALQILPSYTITIGPSKGQMYLYAVNEADGTADWGVSVGPTVTIYPHWVL